VQGYLLRSEGKYRTWKAPPELDEVLSKERKANSARQPKLVTMSDPRPAVTMGVSLLPTFVHFVNQFGGMEILDVDKIPNAQALTEWLFPNVTVSYDDGDALRWENHFSMMAPDDFMLPLAGGLLVSTYSYWIYEAAPMQRGNPLAPAFGEAIPPPKKMPQKAEDPKQPTKGSATATEKEGIVQLNLTESVPVTYTVRRQIAEQVTYDVADNGLTRKAKKTVFKSVEEQHVKLCPLQSTLMVDGKKVQVTRKDGTVIDPKDLPKLLAKEAPVIVVRQGAVDEETLSRLEERTVIIRIRKRTP
jgi:hypothetical protein